MIQGNSRRDFAGGIVIYDSPDFCACKAVRTTNQSITGFTNTAIQLNGTDEFDDDDMHDPSTNNTRITVPVTGRYLIIGHVEWEVVIGPLRYRAAFFAYDGVIEATSVDISRAVLSIEHHNCNKTVKNLTAGQYVELLVQQQNGAASSTAMNVTSAELTVILCST